MIYEFYCQKCNAIDEVVRLAKDSSLPYHCPDCGGLAKRHYTVPQTITKGEDIATYNPAFGQVVTDAQAKRMAKERGWVEVGNEDVAKHTAPPIRKSYDETDYFL